MFFAKDLSELKDGFLRTLRDADAGTYSGVARDRMNFFLWELKLLESFLGLQSFVFAGECGMLDIMLKMQEIWKRLCDTLSVPVADSGAYAYWKEFIESPQRDEFIDPNTDPFPFHVPTEIWKIKLEFRSKYSFPEIPLSANKVDNDIPTPDFVMESINAVVEYLSVLVQISDPCSLLYIPGPKKIIEDALQELKLLSFFSCVVSDKRIEPHTFFTHALIEASHTATVAWLHLPIYGNRYQDPSEVNYLLSDILEMKIRPIQPGLHKIYIDVLQALKSTMQPARWYSNIQNKHGADCVSVENPAQNLMELPTICNPSQIVGLIDQMTILQDMLCLLRANLIHLPILDLEFHLQDMEAVIVDAGLLVYSLYDIMGEKKDTTLEGVNRALGFDLPSNTEPIKAMVYLIIRKAFQSNLPRIQGLGYVDFLLKNLKEFQGRYSDSLAFLKNQLQIIQKEFESLLPFLKVVVEEPHNKLKSTLHEDCATQLISKAYEVEYVVDACISKGVPYWCLERWLLDIIKEITSIKAEIQGKNMVEDTMKTVTARTSSHLARTLRINEEIVGFEDVIENLRNKLLNGTKGQDVISIHGMPGLGKTTLANRLYSDRLVVSQFDICAQCCVSHVYSYKDLLLALLRDAIGEGSERRELHASELADMLRKYLLPRRYLIFVDDVWGNSAWDDLRGCFPDANNRSRIILTTRHYEVAKYASVHSDPLHLRMFNDEESWKLLEKKVFGEENCSPLLIDVGKRIAKMCKQLPLSIALVAGILKEMEKKEECWEKMAENLGVHIRSDSKAIVEQSYQDLPCHLKPCFLYFGAFSEDAVINISKLTRLWISETFIKSCEGKSLEDIAEGYLENLIGRNLVMVAQGVDSDGKVKACRLHDVLLDFCKEKARDENFLLWIKRDQSANHSCVYSYKQHARLAFTEVHNLLEWSSSCSLARSIYFVDRGLSSHTFAISRILQNFKFLKVLDLEHHIVIDFIPTELVYLRYFSAQIYQNSIPSTISNLCNLETLILKRRGYLRHCMLLPHTVWEMVKLKHLHIPDFSTGKAEALLENSATLFYLETLSTPYFSGFEDVELMLRKTPHLRKLICEVEGELEYSQYHVLDFPTPLEILKIYRSKDPFKCIPFCISAPNLKCLKLSGFYLDLRYLSEIAQLKNLEVLKLYCVEFGYHREWKVSNDGFPQLKVLKLDWLAFFDEWIVADDAFPNLEQLILRGCRDLKEIPSSFGEISSLKYIEVENCNEAVVNSARDIQETQVEDYQNTIFNLAISKKKVLKLDIYDGEDLAAAYTAIFNQTTGVEAIGVDRKEKKILVTRNVDAYRVQSVVAKLRKCGNCKPWWTKLWRIWRK